MGLIRGSWLYTGSIIIIIDVRFAYLSSHQLCLMCGDKSIHSIAVLWTMTFGRCVKSIYVRTSRGLCMQGATHDDFSLNPSLAYTIIGR